MNARKEIKLSNGLVAYVDHADYEFLSQYPWRLNAQGYAVTDIRSSGLKLIPYMHRAVLMVQESVAVDHVDGNKLNNCKTNLRIASAAQNGINRGLSKANTSGFKGVTWHSSAQKWQAKITVNYKTIHLGVFANKEDAARAYNAEAERQFGPFARLNII